MLLSLWMMCLSKTMKEAKIQMIYRNRCFGRMKMFVDPTLSSKGTYSLPSTFITKIVFLTMLWMSCECLLEHSNLAYMSRTDYSILFKASSSSRNLNDLVSIYAPPLGSVILLERCEDDSLNVEVKSHANRICSNHIFILPCVEQVCLHLLNLGR